MDQNKVAALNTAIEITKEWAKGGTTFNASPDYILEEVYKKVLELRKDAGL